ncbi:MAG: hypothetical protein H0W50_12065 [Parachlamydiaceae bacterium]|nr:hypothetical protein [Parachlamydiaceae bacterium]
MSCISSIPSNSYVDTLKYLYCDTTASKMTSDKKIELTPIGNNENEHKLKYETYLGKLREDVIDWLETSRVIEKKLIQGPPTPKERAFHLAVAIISTCIPVVGSIVHTTAIHYAEAVLNGIELVHEGVHFTHAFFHQHGSPDHYKIAAELRGKKIEIFFENLIADLTYEFRYEISTLTVEECVKLASKHYNQIIDCFSAIENKLITAQQLYTIVQNYINPDPLDEAIKHIEEYVRNRGTRTFCNTKNHTREEFLKEFSKKIKNKNEIDSLIHQISSRILFCDDWFSHTQNTIEENNFHFSLSNPYIKKLNLVYEKDKDLEEIKIKEKFNNPFLTSILHYNSYYISMKSVSEKIILLLTRALTRNLINRPENIAKNKLANGIIASFISPDIKELVEKVHDLAKRIERIELHQRKSEDRYVKIKKNNIKLTNTISDLKVELNQKDFVINNIIAELKDLKQKVTLINNHSGVKEDVSVINTIGKNISIDSESKSYTQPEKKDVETLDNDVNLISKKSKGFIR